MLLVTRWDGMRSDKLSAGPESTRTHHTFDSEYGQKLVFPGQAWFVMENAQRKVHSRGKFDVLQQLAYSVTANKSLHVKPSQGRACGQQDGRHTNEACFGRFI